MFQEKGPIKDLRSTTSSKISCHIFFWFYRYEIQAVRKSLLSGELENSTMPWKTTEKIFRWMDEIRRQIGVVYKEDM